MHLFYRDDGFKCLQSSESPYTVISYHGTYYVSIEIMSKLMKKICALCDIIEAVVNSNPAGAVKEHEFYMHNSSESRKCFANERVKVTVYDDKNRPFTVDNRFYNGISNLAHGFLVVHESELYPCFDSSDDMYENRFYHWFFICRTYWELFALKKRLRNREIPLRQLFDPSGLRNWESLYAGLYTPMVFCEDGLKGLIVVEKA